MTEEIRRIVREYIRESNVSQAEIARQIGIPPQDFNRALNRIGTVPLIWQRILNHFGLELTVTRKGVGRPPERNLDET